MFQIEISNAPSIRPRVTFDAWLRFAVPLLVALFVLAAVAIEDGV